MEAVPGLAYFRYADDLLLLARERRMALDATERLETAIASLHLRCKPSHSVDLLMASPIADAQFSDANGFRHLGLLFRSGGAVTLSRDKRRKLQNLFRFAFRRRERSWRKASNPRERARLLCAIAADTLNHGVRNVAIFDYYLKHVDDERPSFRGLERRVWGCSIS